jgi:hypothetical protein
MVIQYETLAHQQVTVTSSAVVSLTEPAAGWNRVRRVLIRNLNAAIDWRSDGTDPDGSSFRSLADEIVVLDVDFSTFRMKAVSADADVRIAYFGL